MIIYGRYESRFGPCVLAIDGERLVALGFLRSPSDTPRSIFEELLSNEEGKEDDQAVASFGEQIFELSRSPRLVMRGTEFQQVVWRKLLEVPKGLTWSYQQLAIAIGRPRSVRAVASAVARNPISYVIPCHRIIRTNGEIHHYRWGATLKRELLLAERQSLRPSKRSSLPSDLSSFLN